MKHTNLLYRENPINWKYLTYYEALEYRINAADNAAMFYKNLADKITNKFSSFVYTELLERYKDSIKAKQFNQTMLEELK